MLADLCIPDLAMTTNAQGLAQAAQELKRAGLRRVNISLDTLDIEKYRWLTGEGDLGRTLAGIRAAVESRLLPVKLNTVVLRGINDQEVVDLALFALESGCQIRFLEVMPIGPAVDRFDEWFVSSQEVHASLSTAFDLHPIARQGSDSSRDFLARHSSGRTGVIGFVSPCSEPFCEGCRRLRLTAMGSLVGCLAQSKQLDIRDLVKDDDPDTTSQLKHVVREALRVKRSKRRFSEQRALVEIGG